MLIFMFSFCTNGYILHEPWMERCRRPTQIGQRKWMTCSTVWTNASKKPWMERCRRPTQIGQRKRMTCSTAWTNASKKPWMERCRRPTQIYIACIHPTYWLSLFEIAIWRPVRDFPKSRLLFAGCRSAADTTTAIPCEVQRCRGEGRAGPCQAENWELLNGNQLGNNGDILVMGKPSTM